MDFEEWFTENQAKLYGKPRKAAIRMAWDHQEAEAFKDKEETVKVTGELRAEIERLQKRLDDS